MAPAIPPRIRERLPIKSRPTKPAIRKVKNEGAPYSFEACLSSALNSPRVASIRADSSGLESSVKIPSFESGRNDQVHYPPGQ